MKEKNLIALVLCLLMTVSLLPVSALAEGDGEEPAQPVDTTPRAAHTDLGELRLQGLQIPLAALGRGVPAVHEAVYEHLGEAVPLGQLD